MIGQDNVPKGNKSKTNNKWLQNSAIELLCNLLLPTKSLKLNIYAQSRQMVKTLNTLGFLSLTWNHHVS